MRPLIRSVIRRPLRSLHSSTTVRPRRAQERTIVLGASLAVAGYVGWRIAGSDRRIALDASSKQPLQNSKPHTAHLGEAEADGALRPPPQESPLNSARRNVDPSIEMKENSTPNGGSGSPSDSPFVPEAQNNTSVKIERERDAEGGDEEDEEGQGAFNPVTGEINWDCPCLGGMAHGPCGQQFREAFSCFVFSEQEPKGIDCIEKFKNMQDCFREHPDVYGEEIADDEEDTLEPSSESLTAPTEPSEPTTVGPTPSEPSRHSVDDSSKSLPPEKQ